MYPFKRLPGSQRAPSGLEWSVLKKIPLVLSLGTLLFAFSLLLLQSGWIDLDTKELLKAQYAAIGMLLFHWMSTITLALLCIIVVVMKGHAYVMDAYALPDSERPKSSRPARRRR